MDLPVKGAIEPNTLEQPMARAHSVSSSHEFGADTRPGEWQALRGELVALLDQVETQYVRSGGEPGADQLARQVQDLRRQVAPEGSGRHQEALRTVKRAVDRFTEREEHLEAMPTRPTNPQDTLQSAIHEIRSRQTRRQARPEPMPAPELAEPRIDMAAIAAEQAKREREAERLEATDRFERMVGAVSGVSGRLEQLESELKSQAVRQSDVGEIGRQVSNLTGVVEVLAGAVGETGQVKHLESQLDELARAIQHGSRVDMTALTQRIGALSETVERLADMQAQQIAHERSMLPQTAALQEGMRSVEANLRQVYDRIDGIERNYLLAPQEFERLTDEVAEFSRLMREHEGEPAKLIALVDALHARIDEMDSRDDALVDLREDVVSLRGAVISTFEPRFSTLEDQIDALGEQISARQPSEQSINEISDQIRYMVRRIDDTGEQLTGLARLYTDLDGREPAPDFEALAAMVASRTSEAVALVTQREPALDMDALATLVARKTSEAVARTAAAPAPQALSDEGLDALEARMSRMFKDSSQDKSASELTGMQDGIRRVDQRLERLETAIERAQQSNASLSAAPEAAPQIPVTARARDRDQMPVSIEETVSRPHPAFAAMGTVREALAGKMPAPEMVQPAIAQFDPSSVERPARPLSSFDVEQDPFAPAGEERRGTEATEASANSSRNTFIEAARRAAQRQGQSKAELSANSLISRALARFQGEGEDAPEGDQPIQVAAMPAPETKPRKKRKTAEKTASTAPAVERPLNADELRIEPRDGEEGSKESFLLRNRQPVLLACAVIAVSFMTLNLVNQRMGASIEPEVTIQSVSAEAQTNAELANSDAPLVTAENTAPLPSTDLTATAQASASLSPSPGPLPALVAAGPRVDMAATNVAVDPTPVGSINPDVPNFARAPELRTGATEATQSSLLSTPAETLPAETAPVQTMPSPVKLELPPEKIGPEAMRQAAADGDPRAQFEVAAIYTEGRAVTQDLAAAATWYERAAAQGFAPAEYRIGSLYESGKGVEKDLEQARLWYTRGAEAGNRMSMHNLAALYAGGELGPQDFASAAHWFEEAASRGMTDSQFNLGMLYARGLGVGQNMEASFKWFSLAAARGDTDAAKARDDMAKSLDAEVMARVAAEIAGFVPTPIDLAANFAPIGTWSTSFDPGAPISDRELVLKVQSALVRLGYEVGVPDGKAGPKTTEAIKSFEKATGMSEIGTINPRLLAVLGSQPV